MHGPMGHQNISFVSQLTLLRSERLTEQTFAIEIKFLPRNIFDLKNVI